MYTIRRRWSDNDRHFWRFTYARERHQTWGAELRSGADEHPGCNLLLRAFGHTLIVDFPPIIKPERKWVDCTGKWDGATGGYWDERERAYGFHVSEGHFSVSHGRQTHDSSTERRWSCFLPWTQWRFVRFSLFGLDGRHFWTAERGARDWDEQRRQQGLCPTSHFTFSDYDGQQVIAATQIHEREWKFGEGYFKWLSLFRRPKISRSLDLQFDKEVGPGKGSWKGGMIGHSIEMLPGELHEAAFRRYCDKGCERKGRKTGLMFIGPVVA